MKKDSNKNILVKEADYGDYKEIYITIHPEIAETKNILSFQEQSKNCLNQLRTFFDENSLTALNILSIVSLLRVEDDEEYQKNCNIFEDEINNLFKLKTKHIVGYTAQAPYQSKVALEVTLIVIQNEKVKYTQKEINVSFNEKDYTIGYGVIESEHTKELNIEGVGVNEHFKNTFFQAEGAYFILNEVLKKEGMTIKNIVCQRNHIDSIVEVIKDKDGKTLQRYQIYNEKRGDNFGQKRWNDGYPAATGIGMNAGGVNILSIRAKALKSEDEKIKVFPITNPDQIDPHKYSKKVLVGDVAKTSPQWERAKAIVYENRDVRIYVSGTASVRGKKKGEAGEEVIGVGDVVKQVHVTLENIELLISQENLNNSGIQVNKKVDLHNLVSARVYVKNEEDFEKVIEICEEYFSDDLPITYVIADVCRPDWLMEIEGIAKTEIK
ncbi:MAG: hypothetical protein KAT32_04010 [Candidatus Moranbacteria bacterium]|nr:hypothetical protein [Candidatus Moranbacteria bacterium]